MGGEGLAVGKRDSLSSYLTSFGDPNHFGFVFSPFRVARGRSSLHLQLQGVTAAFHGHQGVGRVETYHRSLGGEDAVLYGDHTVGSSFRLEKRLDVLYRPEGCSPSLADSPIKAQVSQVHS